VKKDKMKVMEFNKLAKPHCIRLFLNTAPPPRQVKARATSPTAKVIEGKGSVTFLMTVDTAAKSKTAKQYTHIHKIKRQSRKLQSRKIARRIKQAPANGAITMRAPRSNIRVNDEPEDACIASTSAPISKAFMATEKQLDSEINDMNQWEVESANNDGFESDDDGGLEGEEENVSNLNDVMETEIKEGILNGTIPSAAYDTAATSSP